MAATATVPSPTTLQDSMSGLALAAAAANVVMQLSRLEIGHGVANSKVESGRLDRHPLKRTRTTLTYLAVALLGTDEERKVLRKEVNRAHRQVRSKGPVAYNAFDPELQLWVAACLYQGVEIIDRILYGEPTPEQVEELYKPGARLGTTLQVREEMWPPDRAAFEENGQDGPRRSQVDDHARGCHPALPELRFLRAPDRLRLASTNRYLPRGCLPQRFRGELGYSWAPRAQRRFDRLTRTLARVNAVL